MRLRQRDWVALVLAATTIAVSAFALGSVTRWGTCLAGALALATAAPMLRSQRTPVGPSPLLLFFALAIAFTLAQYVLLPTFMVRDLAPATYDLQAGNADALGEKVPRLMPLSLDRPGTLLELAKLAGYFAFAVACMRIANVPRGRRWLLTSVALTGIALAAVASSHHLVGAHKLFGFYAPRDARPPPPYLAPLLNANHLAGYLAMATPCALALAATSGGAIRLMWIAGAALASATCLLSRSRAGSVALAVGLVASVALWGLGARRRARGTHRKAPRSVTLSMALVALCGLILVGALSAGGVVQEFAATRRSEFRDPRSKFYAWTSASVLLRDHRWTGVGRGAFEPAFTRVHQPSKELTFSRLENEYLQAAVEWGLPAAAALAIALILVGIAAWRRWHEGPLEAGALGGLLAIALHNAADFSLELPALALPTVALLATVVYVSLSASANRPRWLVPGRAAMWSAGVALVLIAATPLARTVREDGDRLAVLVDDPAVPRAEVITAARATMRRHPADYYPAAVVARAELDEGKREAVPMLNRALLLHPFHPGVHLLAARALHRFGYPEQALVEYSLALAYGYDPALVLPELIGRYGDAEAIARGVPRSPALALPLAARFHDLHRPDVAVLLCRRLLDQRGDDITVLRYLASLLHETGDHAGAIDAARRALAAAPSPATAMTLGEALDGAGNRVEAQRVLTDGLALARRTASPQDDIEILNLLSAVAFARGSYPEAKAAMSELLALAGSDRRLRALVHRKLAEIENAMGNAHQASWELDRAKELEGP